MNEENVELDAMDCVVCNQTRRKIWFVDEMSTTCMQCQPVPLIARVTSAIVPGFERVYTYWNPEVYEKIMSLEDYPATPEDVEDHERFVLGHRFLPPTVDQAASIELDRDDLVCSIPSYGDLIFNERKGEVTALIYCSSGESIVKVWKVIEEIADLDAQSRFETEKVRVF